MATITSAKSGNWGTTSTWVGGVVPTNGDSAIIAEGHQVMFNVDQSGFANGLAGLTINGILYWNNAGVTCLKMNGNITGTGRLYVAGMWEMNPVEYEYDPVPGYPNVWRDYGIAAIETLTGARFTPVDSIEEVNETPNSIYQVREEGSLVTYWNDADPVNRYFTGINRPVIGSEYRAHILFNSTGTINVPHIQMYGEYPEREWTQLSADASAGQNQIVLKEDLGLQQGDMIIISAIIEDNYLSETAKGAYTVQSYDGVTKTITLTTNLQTNRLTGDYVAWFSRPIKIARTSGTAGLITPLTGRIDNGVIKGVKSNNGNLVIATAYNELTNYASGWVIDHCVNAGRVLVTLCTNLIIQNSINGGLYSFMATCEGTLKNSISISSSVEYYSKGICDNIISVNGAIHQYKGMSMEYHNSIIKNVGANGEFCEGSFINCNLTAQARGNGPPVMVYLKDCTILTPSFGAFGNSFGKLINCLFIGDYTVADLNNPYRSPTQIMESFDHNQVEGDYRAWCKGGRIETVSDGGIVQPSQLIFNCESADYPVFRDFQIQLPKIRTMRWQALANKSFTGGNVKIELIDPTADPLIDSSAQPLASYSLPDTADTNLPLKLGYKSTVPMQAILRISAQNSTGTVEIDTRLIENRVQHGR
jgi:hypothetical protein